MRTNKSGLLGAVAVLALVLLAWAVSTGTASADRKAVVDARGNMKVPEGYRTSYEYLGTWAVAADDGKGSKELHTVYASPGTIAAYRSTGRFPNQTVLVKEVFETKTASLTTGTVNHAATESLKGWFLMVKDERAQFPDNKLWGEGWGWAWFDAGAPGKSTSTDYKSDCLACHVPAKQTDWLYVQGYPPLRR